MAAFKSVDHVGITVKSLEVSVPWWSYFLEAEPFWQASWLAAVFRTWGQIDPEAAAARAGTLLPSAKAAASRALLELDLPLAELRTMVERLDETGPASNIQRQAQLMTGAPQLSQSAYLLAEIEARSHARRDGESHADAWERAISFEGESLVRQILIDRIVIEWAMQEPAAAMAAVESWTTDDEYQPFVTGGGFAPQHADGDVPPVPSHGAVEPRRCTRGVDLGNGS